MRAWPRISQVSSTPAATITTTTETVGATLSAVSTQSADNVVVLMGYLDVTTGTGTTAVVVRVRRGVDATGTLIQQAVTEQVTAGNEISVPIFVQDTPGEVSNQSYVITVQQTAATANGTLNRASLVGAY